VALRELRGKRGAGAVHGHKRAARGLAQGGGHAFGGDVAAPDETPADDTRSLH
jgi:hypothetical protein